MALKDKAKIEKLLKVYSCKDISKTFIQIDEKLVSLHECSANDFSQLNKDFKKLFNQLKVITDNINNIILFLEQDESIEIFQKVKSFANELYSSLISYKNEWDVKRKRIVEVSDQLELMFFPVKNGMQNLMILKYLLTNLRILLPSYIVNSEVTQLNEKEINLLFEKINSNFTKISAVSSKKDEIKEPNINIIGVTLLDIITKVDNLEKIFKSNKACFINLKKKKLDTDSNISDIVKKLQYHDIIRQKMEHIQRTHQDLIDELNMFNNIKNDEESLIQKAKYYLKIRDVSGIQAAQLIQANREYQNAIETIVNNFVHVLTSIEDLKNMCDNTSKEGTVVEYKIFDQIINRLESAQNEYNLEYVNYNIWHKNIEEIELAAGKSVKYVDELKKEVSNLEKLVKTYLEKTLENLSGDENLEKTETQIRNLLNELNDNKRMLSDIVENISKEEQNVQLEASDKKILKEVQFDVIVSDINKLKDNRKSIDQKLTENKSIGNQSLCQIRKSISEIKYYEYFEKVINEITVELNEMNIKLRKDNDFETESLNDHLNKLKEYYTVETEHQIHENIEKGEDIDVENNEDGEIEFF